MRAPRSTCERAGRESFLLVACVVAPAPRAAPVRRGRQFQGHLGDAAADLFDLLGAPGRGHVARDGLGGEFRRRQMVDLGLGAGSGRRAMWFIRISVAEWTGACGTALTPVRAPEGLGAEGRPPTPVRLDPCGNPPGVWPPPPASPSPPESGTNHRVAGMQTYAVTYAPGDPGLVLANPWECPADERPCRLADRGGRNQPTTTE